MIKRNTAIAGFSFLVFDKNGVQQTTGNVTGYYSHDGTYQGNTAAPAYDSSLNSWKVTLTTTVMDADVVSLTFSHDGTGIDVHFQLHTEVKTIDDLQDLSAAQVNAEADSALSDYDGPTKSELDSAQSSIEAEINANEAKIDTAQADLDLITGSDGATLATSQSNYTPAVAGDNMNLADDAITSAKFDETTAFPLVSADTGSTAVARTGAAADTLETLSDQVDGVSTFDATTDEVDIGNVKGVGVTDIDDFKADVSGVATAANLTTVDTVVDAIQTVTDQLPNGGALSDISLGLNNIEYDIGIPKSLDGGADTLAGMLTKIADDSTGAAFDASTDSLHEMGAAAGGTDWTTGEKEQVRSALGITGDKTAATGGQLQTIDTVVDGIQTDLDNPIDGLGAIRGVVDANQADLTTIESKVDIADGVIDGVQATVDHVTYGLAASKTNLDAGIDEITDELGIMLPQTHIADSTSVVNAGDVISGVYTDTSSNNQQYWEIDSTGLGIDVMLSTVLGDFRQPSHIVFDGYFTSSDSTSGDQMSFYAYNYQDSVWDNLSTDETLKMKHRTTDRTYVLPLGFEHHKHSPVGHGEVQIRVVADNPDVGASLNIDQFFVSSYLESNTPISTISEAVWTSRHGDELKRIDNKISGDIWYVDPDVGDDTNNGHFVFSPLKTIAVALFRCNEGDLIKLAAKEFVETGLELGTNRVEIRGEYDSVIKTNGGIGLTVTGTGCKIKDVQFSGLATSPNPTNAILISPGSARCIVSGGIFLGYPIAIDIQSGSGASVLDNYFIYCTYGVKVQGTAAIVNRCFALNPTSAGNIGFDLSSTAVNNSIEACHTQGQSVTGFNVAAGANANFIINCVSGANDANGLTDNGTDTTIVGFNLNSDVISDINIGVDNIEAKLPAGTISDFNASTDGVDVTSIEGITLSAKVGDNLDYFFQNAGADTSKVIDDVGAGAGGGFTSGDRTTLNNIPVDVDAELTANHDGGSWVGGDSTSGGDGGQTGIVWT